MYNYGFVKVDRNIVNWSWYKDSNTYRVYMHLMYKANYSPMEFRGKTINRGQLIMSRSKIAEDLNLSEQQVRTALDHLKSTNDITIEKGTRFVIITINNYGEFLAPTKKSTRTSTRTSTEYQQNSNEIATECQPLYNNKYNKYNKNNNIYNARKREKESYSTFSIEDFESKSLFND